MHVWHMYEKKRTCRILAMQMSYSVGRRKPWGLLLKGSGSSMEGLHCNVIHLPLNLLRTPF